MTSRRLRIPAAHRVSGGEPPLASHGMQNSQRVHDAKPRTAVASRHGQWRGAGGARRGVGVRSHAPRRWRGGAMGTSRPTAKPHEGCARRCRAATGRAECCGSMKNGFGNVFSVNLIELQIFLLRVFHGSGTFSSRCAAHSGLILTRQASNRHPGRCAKRRCGMAL